MSVVMLAFRGGADTAGVECCR